MNMQNIDPIKISLFFYSLAFVLLLLVKNVVVKGLNEWIGVGKGFWLHNERTFPGGKLLWQTTFMHLSVSV